jgi:hypothetical protein
VPGPDRAAGPSSVRSVAASCRAPLRGRRNIPSFLTLGLIF